MRTKLYVFRIFDIGKRVNRNDITSYRTSRMIRFFFCRYDDVRLVIQTIASQMSRTTIPTCGCRPLNLTYSERDVTSRNLHFNVHTYRSNNTYYYCIADNSIATKGDPR